VDFVVDNAELDRLEALLDQFNLFEAIGVARQELRHSDFLAFLLDPHQSHGLGDAFAKRLLQRALLAADDDAAPIAPISPIDLDVWSLAGMTVQREWRNVDLLLVDEAHRLVVVIENKIGSGEHSGQLGRYLQIAAEAHPGWRLLGLYLTPDGDVPSDPRYLAVGYDLVCEIVEGVADRRSPSLDPAVHTAMTHYARMLRRHVVSDSEIAELCQRIYGRHRRAIDLIYEHRESQQAAIKDVLLALITSTSQLKPDFSDNKWIRFAHAGWDTPAMMSGRGWTRSGRILLLQFTNLPDSLTLRLYVGPGPAATRQRLFNAARTGRPPLQVVGEDTNRWTPIYSRPFLGPDDYVDASAATLEARIEQQWADFVQDDLGQIVDALADAVADGIGHHPPAAPDHAPHDHTHP